MAVIVKINGERTASWANGNYMIVNKNYIKDRKMKLVETTEPKKFSVKLEIPDVVLSDDNTRLTCEAVGNRGLGVSMGSQGVVLRVIDPPKITTEFPTQLSRVRGAKASVQVDCKATGKPKPTVAWKRKNGAEVSSDAAQAVYTKSVDGGLRLLLAGPIRDAHDGAFVCVATPPRNIEGVTAAQREFTFSVYYKPELVFQEKRIHTELGTSETLKIEATGNPSPDVSCEVLTLPEPKLVRFTPQPGHKVTYEVTLKSVQQQDIRKYTCNASNSVGVASDTITLTLNPSVPKILSKNSTTFADYYELHWEVKSKAAVSNVTVEVHVRDNEKGGENATKLLRTDVFKLGPGRVFKHHIANLTQNTVHELRLRACNTRGCSPQSSSAAFMTQSYDGTNTVNPAILVKAITVAPAASTENGGSPSFAPVLLTSLLAVFFALSHSGGL